MPIHNVNLRDFKKKRKRRKKRIKELIINMWYWIYDNLQLIFFK